MDYVTETRISARSLSQGRGTSDIRPTTALSLSEILDHLEEHPCDSFMLEHLDDVVKSDGKEGIGEVAQRFKKRPSAVTFGVLLKTLPNPEANEALTGFENKQKLLGFIYAHPSIDIRGMNAPDYLMVQRTWNTIFRANRENHQQFSEMDSITFAIPANFLELARKPREYTHVRDLVEVSDSNSVRAGTSLRTIAPKETYKRIEKISEQIMNGSHLIGFGFCGTYFIGVDWDSELAVSIGRNQYTLKGKSANSGKGLDHITAIASGMMEMLERYSAGLGCTPNFPDGYEVRQEFRKAKHSQLISSGVDALNPNSLSLRIPYQDQELYWILGEVVTSDGKKEIYVPAQHVYLFSNLDEIDVCRGSSNGLASGNTMAEAKLHSLLEII